MGLAAMRALLRPERRNAPVSGILIHDGIFRRTEECMQIADLGIYVLP